MLRDQDLFWLQRTKNLWKIHGDKCTEAFHKVVNNCNMKNNINSLKTEGSNVTNLKQIRAHINFFSKDLYTKLAHSRPFLLTYP